MNNILQEKIKKLLKDEIPKKEMKRISRFQKGEVFFRNDTIVIKHPYNLKMNKKYQYFGGFKFDATTKNWELIKKNDFEIAKFILNLPESEPSYYWTVEEEALNYLEKVINKFEQAITHHRDVLSLKKREEIDWDVSHLKVKPFGFQRVGMAFLEKNNGIAFIGDDMGLGKSMQFIGYTAKFQYKTLVVCPASLKYNLQREVHNFTHLKAVVLSEYKKVENIPLDANYYICNYEQLKKYFKFLSKQKFDCIVVDESHNIKNGSAERTKLVKKFSKIPRRILLSGTAIKNAPIEFYTQLNFLKPDLFPLKAQYGLRYCDAKPSEHGFGYDYGGSSNLRELNSKIASFYIRRLKINVLKELPPKTLNQIELELSSANQTEYNKLVKDLKTKYKTEGGASGFLTQTVKLKQYLSQVKIKEVVEFTNNLIEQDPKKKVIVFSQFINTQETLLNVFGAQANSILGSYSDKKRMAELDEFGSNPDKRVLVASTLAAGVGLNITAADTVIFCDLMWAPADHQQAEDRAFRIGQKNPVNIYYFIYRDTVDSLLWKLLDFKIDLLGQVLDGKEVKESLDERQITKLFVQSFLQQ